MGTEITPMVEVQNTLARMSDQFKMALPKHISPEKFIRTLQTAVQNNPDILQCNRPSFYNACMKCAADGLLADGREAAIVKFGSDAAYLPMVGGILKLIRNSGELATIDADVVHEKDEYDSWVDERGQHFKFKKARGERGAPLLTFAYAIMKDGALYFEEVNEQEMAGIQKVARSQNVWTGAFRDEMKKKSAIHRMAKRMPKSTDIEQVLKADEELYDLEKPQEEKPKETTSSRLSEAVGAVKTGVEPSLPTEGRAGVAEAVVVPPTAQPGQDKPVSATVNPPREAIATPTGKILTAVLFEKESSKSGTTNGKPWIKYAGLINGEWYGTFDKKFHDSIVYSIANKALMTVNFLDKVVGDKTYHEIIDVQVSTIDDAQASGEIPSEEIPY